MNSFCQAQLFWRQELPTILDTPWEIEFGPDRYLWVTEAGGKVSRVDPNTGDKLDVYVAPDYFAGDSSEANVFCPNKQIGFGTFGLALHPEFLVPDSAFIYYVYSYNHGDAQNPDTKFKIVRLKWDENTTSVTQTDDLITNLPNGYDHWGGRLISAKMSGNNYLFYSIGDLGISEDADPSCYSNQADNPNNFTQDPDSLQGKIHRFNMDGSIPADNPISGNSFYSRGHRNPQGLAFNPTKELIYGVEHGDRIDDEVNVLRAGMNYGWKDVRGFANDGSHVGEQQFANTYAPHPNIAGDQLVDPIYAWCSDPSLNGSSWNEWCTVAPSGAEYIGNSEIPEWQNSLIVTTLKDGDYTDKSLRVLRLNDNGDEVIYEQTFFAEDQDTNGRLRDVAVADFGTVFLINNGGADRDKITAYHYIMVCGPWPPLDLEIFPNPSNGVFNFHSPDTIVSAYVYSLTGDLVDEQHGELYFIDLRHVSNGYYRIKLVDSEGRIRNEMILRE